MSDPKRPWWRWILRLPATPNDGVQAARQGFQLDANPFCAPTPAHSIWRDDWLDANGRRT